MNKYSITVKTDDWVELVSADTDYILQNTDSEMILVSANDAKPTDIDGAIKLPTNGILTHNILSGTIYGKASTKRINKDGDEIGQSVSVHK